MQPRQLPSFNHGLSHWPADSGIQKLHSLFVRHLIQVRILSFHSLTVGYVVLLFSRFMLGHKTELPSGWVPRILAQCGLSFETILDIFTYLYESQV